MSVFNSGGSSIGKQLLAGVLFFVIVFTGCTGGVQKRMLVLVSEQQGDVPNFEQIRQIAVAQEIAVDSTTQIEKFSEDSLTRYTSVLFLGVAADTLNFAQRVDLQRFVDAGGGVLFAGPISDSLVNWPWLATYNKQRLEGGQPYSSYDVGEGSVVFVKNTTEVVESQWKDGIERVNDGGHLDYARVSTERVPETNRFVVEVLDTYMYEPMEMVVFNDGRILYVERRGDIKLYDPKLKKSRTIATFDVSITGNYEDGILGVALDPNFEKNRWIYINYSPAGNVPKQNVSRFEMRGDSILRHTEKIVLEIPTQRETCCHSGGHLTFGPGGNLYISTGDNTSSKESDGFSPIDERPGRAPFDAQKSSGNTHDLRGKILRIHPEPDGSYTIPDGNLFPKDGSKGKPEIYVMGTRNAFRFSVDPKTGFVYWGDVGPDGGVTNERGPESFDEFNQAKQPGNYGWPYFVADNKAYADFDFATNAIGPKFDPERPENLSPNNTGAKILPPAQKPMIWYPYGDSREFPIMGKGSRSAMAGPVYYYEEFENATSRFPKYFDRKLFIYEWARSWVNVVSFDENWNLTTIEPFLPGQEWYKPIDMKFGADGALYVLQYGANYFEHNPDSRLVKITYVAGNREPVAKITADKTVGATPLTVKLSAKESFDADKNDELAYAWEFPGSDSQQINGAEAVVTYNKAGNYRPVLKVTDREGKTSKAELLLRAGNEMPSITIATNGANRSFYFDGSRLDYTVQVNDREDGSVSSGIDPQHVFVSFDYLKEGKDLALLESNAQLAGSIRHLRGRNLLEQSDCKTCHTPKDNSIGPSYSAIADRYKAGNPVNALADKIIKGGNGNWGKNMMAAHPQHTNEEAAEMVKYILAINDQVKGLPVSGSLPFSGHDNKGTPGSYVMRASYTDKGAPGAGNLTNSGLLILRHPQVQAEECVLDKKMNIRHIDGTDVTFVNGIDKGAYLKIEDVDLTGINSIQVSATSRYEGTVVELRTGSADGTVLGQVKVGKNKDDKKAVFQTLATSVKPSGGIQDLYLVFGNPSVNEDLAVMDWIRFSRK